MYIVYFVIRVNQPDAIRVAKSTLSKHISVATISKKLTFRPSISNWEKSGWLNNNQK